MTDADVAMGRVVADRYVIGRVLGSGTMGTVRAALDLELNQEVAIKFVNVDGVSRDEAIERFRREVQVAERIKSEHVVRVLGTGSLSDETPFMVMELLRGRGLDEERDLRGVIPIGEAVGYILQAIEVLAEVHAVGVVHRDMKPAHLFLEARPPGPHFVKVLDFGVSKSAGELASTENAATKDGMIMGSPLYMAPEQLRASNSADARADIWSLGAILFELITGFTAHQGDTVAEVCASLLRDPPRPITDFASELPLGFVEVVTRCLEPERERRYSNVAELGAALLPFAPNGALHVERARRLLERSAIESIRTVDLAPSSDAPVTLHVGGATDGTGN
ncbi:MAG TPA: serine/threonine-protein kinase, partial [Polyangiaceae bacterium]|nr:serine/threonine-protein kinase [Polyangiaceae bacterium]